MSAIVSMQAATGPARVIELNREWIRLPFPWGVNWSRVAFGFLLSVLDTTLHTTAEFCIGVCGLLETMSKPWDACALNWRCGNAPPSGLAGNPVAFTRNSYSSGVQTYSSAGYRVSLMVGSLEQTSYSSTRNPMVPCHGGAGNRNFWRAPYVVEVIRVGTTYRMYVYGFEAGDGDGFYDFAPGELLALLARWETTAARNIKAGTCALGYVGFQSAAWDYAGGQFDGAYLYFDNYGSDQTMRVHAMSARKLQ